MPKDRVKSPAPKAEVDVFRFASWCLVIGVLSCIVYVLSGPNSDFRGAAGGIGTMASLFGSGVSLWFAVRSGEHAMSALAVLSLIPLGFWGWALHKAVCGG
jgi:hypothetical protein